MGAWRMASCVCGGARLRSAGSGPAAGVGARGPVPGLEHGGSGARLEQLGCGCSLNWAWSCWIAPTSRSLDPSSSPSPASWMGASTLDWARRSVGLASRSGACPARDGGRAAVRGAGPWLGRGSQRASILDQRRDSLRYPCMDGHKLVGLTVRDCRWRPRPGRVARGHRQSGRGAGAGAVGRRRWACGGCHWRRRGVIGSMALEAGKEACFMTAVWAWAGSARASFSRTACGPASRSRSTGQRWAASSGGSRQLGHGRAEGSAWRSCGCWPWQSGPCRPCGLRGRARVAGDPGRRCGVVAGSWARASF